MAPENHLAGLVSAISSPVGSGAKPPQSQTKLILVHFELKNRTVGNGFNKRSKKNRCIDRKCRNGVAAFKKLVERCSGAFQLNLSALAILIINVKNLSV